MSVRRLAAAAAVAALLLSQALFAQAAAAQSDWLSWDINSFETDIVINRDSSITVSEKVVADFRNDKHRGIFRYIPVRYRDRYGNKMNLRFNLLSVKDETGKAWNYESWNEGDDIFLKIGDPEVYLNDLSTFIITYKVERAVTYFEEHDELYWNSTGTEWGVPMQKVSTKVTLPESPSEGLKATCYTGGYGAQEQNCTHEISAGSFSFEVVPTKEGAPALNPRQGLTVVVGFPQGIVEKPTLLQQALWTLSDNWGYFLPFITFGIMFWLWKTRGRDPRVSRTAIMPIYRPPNGLTPTEIGTIIDEKVDTRDISATIIDLAVRGYIKINELKEKKWFFDSTDYEFELIKNIQDDPSLKDHEKKIAKAVFGSLKKRKLSALKEVFYSSLPDIRSSVYNGLIRDGYFPGNPETVRTVYYSIGGFIIGATVFLFVGFLLFLSLSVPVGLILSGIIILIFAGRMPAKTKKGAETYYLIKGLEEYIATAEKDRIKWQEGENIFELLLPYALTLGLADKWANAFQGIYKDPPSWYTSTDPNFMNHFTTLYLLNSLTSVNSSMQSTFTSSPRSAAGGGSGFSSGGGGGFSGGGFGGGGGGAW